jgi:hypothetical protein
MVKAAYGDQDLSRSSRPKKLRFPKSRVKTMLVIFFDWQGVIHNEFVPEGETINAVYYKDVM